MSLTCPHTHRSQRKRPARCRCACVSTDDQDLSLPVDSLIGLGVAGDFQVLPVIPSLGCDSPSVRTLSVAVIFRSHFYFHEKLYSPTFILLYPDFYSVSIPGLFC